MIDPSHELQGAMSDEEPVAVAGPSDIALRLQKEETNAPIVQVGQWGLVWLRFRRHKFAMAGLITLLLLSLMAILAPLISPETYVNWDYLNANNLPPRWTFPGAGDWKYIMGSDGNGHSLLMWIAYGARVSLAVGLVSSVLTMTIAVVLGGTAGFYGGWIDAILMRITDVFLTLPTLPLLILLSAYVSKGSALTIIALFAILSWPGAARLVRSYYLSYRDQEFTQAARAVGVSDTRIIFRHILPNALSPIIVATTLAVAGFIGAEAAIDFLGVGIRPPTTSWGLSLANSQTYFGQGNWWWALFPGLFLLLTTLSINFVGDGLRDALDVRSRGH